MDVDGLIAAVRSRNAVWDKTYRKYGNRLVMDRCWNEICEELGEDELKVRKKWKYLRDNFSLELGKIIVSGRADAKSKWPYYEPLSFLKNVVKPRSIVARSVSPGTFVDQTNESGEAYSDDDAINIKEEHEEQSLLVERSATADPLCSGRKRSFAAMNGEAAFEMPIEYSREVPDDEHVHFFKSLLPHVRKIPQDKLLSFRNKVQELVELYAYQ